ncbi:alpha/beta fold hydrolase [Nocardia brasiliensis]|uniref:alpha/beta fold hydrolase n=1 Tax=Nocardia brasiliensis TaxID=37326 RepID=UPI003D8D5F1D
MSERLTGVPTAISPDEKAAASMGDAAINFLDKGDGHSLLFLHGLGADLRVWRNQTASFVDEYRCIAPDMRGAGASIGPPQQYDLAAFADDTAELCTRLGVVHAHVVGQSLGGIVGQQLAFRYPAMVDTLTLVGTSGRAVPPAERPLGPSRW